MHLRIKMSYLEAVLVHPVRRQNFGDAMSQKCNHYQIRCHIFLKRKWYEDLKSNVPKCLTSKYTNIVWVNFADKPNMCYIFEKSMVRGPQKQYSRVSDVSSDVFPNRNGYLRSLPEAYKIRWCLDPSDQN